MKATELSPTAVKLSSQQAAAPERRDATDIIADAYNEVMSDPVVRTSHDAAKYILDALDAAGHRPMLHPIPKTTQEAAAAIVALINCSPRSPRQEEIEAILARFGGAPAQEGPISDLRTRLRRAMANADAALDASCKLLGGPELAAAEAELTMWSDEIAAMEDEIPNPPRSFEDLVTRAEIARHGGDIVDGRLMEAEDEEDVFQCPAARLVEAVLQFAKGGKP